MFKETWVGVLLSCLTVTASQAATIVLSDFDNTIVETRESAGGTFESPFVLFRIDQRANTLQEVADGPKEITLTPIEYHRNQAYFGKGNGQPGALNRTIKLKDGSSVNPGMYYMRNPDSFRYFFSEPGRNNLLEDLKAAEKRDPKGEWQGAFWKHMVEILSTPETAKTFGLITARGHTEADWREFFQYLLKQGYIANEPNYRLFHNVANSDYDQFSMNWDTSQSKVGVLKEIVVHLGRTPVHEERITPDGKSTEPYHYLIFENSG